MLGNSVWTFSLLLAGLIIWFWDSLIIILWFFRHQTVLRVSENKPGASRFGDDWGSTEPVECAVCLSMIGEDEEISLLRCKHLFHHKCLDRCVEHGQVTCPLCRDYLAAGHCELGRELIVFCFRGGASDDDDYGKWWLR